MQLNADVTIKFGSILPDKCQVEKVVELSSEELDAIIADPEASLPFLMENKGLMRDEDGVAHCLLALGWDMGDGVLVLAEENRLPRRAYLAGARTILQGALEQAADRIIADALENTSEGSWCVYFDELYEQMGLVVTQDNGIGPMLLDVLSGRPEVAKVELTDDCFNAVYYLSYCKNLATEPEETAAERQDRLINDIMNYLGEHHDSSELYRMFHCDLGMTHEEIESLGFDLSNCYEERPGLEYQQL